MNKVFTKPGNCPIHTVKLKKLRSYKEVYGCEVCEKEESQAFWAFIKQTGAKFDYFMSPVKHGIDKKPITTLEQLNSILAKNGLPTFKTTTGIFTLAGIECTFVVRNGILTIL